MIADDSPLDPTSAYGATKACVEQIARRYHANHGLSVVGLRLGKVYGYGEHVKAGRGGGNTWFSSLLENLPWGIGPNFVLRRQEPRLSLCRGRVPRVPGGARLPRGRRRELSLRRGLQAHP